MFTRKKAKKYGKKDAVPMHSRDMSVSHRIEQIKNGHLLHVSTSHTDEKGNYHHETETTFHRKDPRFHSRIKSAFKKITGKDLSD